MRLLGPAVAMAILALVFARIPLALVRDALGNARLERVAAALAAALVVQVVDAARFRRWTDAHGLRLSTRQLLRINLATQCYGLLLPGGSLSGMAVRCSQLPTGRAKIATVVSFVADQTVLTLAMCSVGVVLWLADHPAEGLVTAAAMVALAGTGFLARIPLRALVGSHAVRRLLSRLRNRIRTVAGGAWPSHLNRGTLLWIGTLAVVSNLLRVLVYYLLARALGLGLSLVSVGWVRSLMIVATMPPITVSGLGLREGASLLLLSRYGIPAERIVAFSLAVFAVTLVFGLVGGVLEVGRVGRSLWARLTAANHVHQPRRGEHAAGKVESGVYQ